MSFDLPRRVAKPLLHRTLEEGWGLGVRITGRITPGARRVPSPVTAEGRRVLVVAPHPDDETIGAGGAAALHARAGDELTVLTVTDGGASRAGGLEEADMVRRRAEEVRAATAILGVRDLICLGLPEGRWGAGELSARLSSLLRDVELVYAPSCVDFHPEHLRVARVLAPLLPPTVTVRVYELGVPLTPWLVNRAVHLDGAAELKARALATFHTQAVSIAAVRRLARYQARYYGTSAVEVFWEMSAAAFAAVMAKGDWEPGPSPYRGIRPSPLGDPLAALVGLGERVRLRRIALEAARAPAARAGASGGRSEPGGRHA